jgi:RNA polymerase sigma-70 factor (ECF subfamily)
MTGPTTTYLQGCLDRVRSGDAAAREDLLRHSQERLRAIAHRMLGRFPSVRRSEETDDVLQELMIRLDRMLGQLEVRTVRDYLRLAATNLRRVLIDLARHYLEADRHRPAGQATPVAEADPADGRPIAHEPAADPASDPRSLAEWTEFHDRVGRLPQEHCEVFDLLWYHGLTHGQAAEVLGVSLTTVKRRWLAARILLMEAFPGDSPF